MCNSRVSRLLQKPSGARYTQWTITRRLVDRGQIIHEPRLPRPVDEGELVAVSRGGFRGSMFEQFVAQPSRATGGGPRLLSLARSPLSPSLMFSLPPSLSKPPPLSCLHSSFSFLTGRLYTAFHRLVCSFQRLVCHFRDSCEHFRGSCVHFRDPCAANIQALLQLHLIPHPPSSVSLSPTYNSPHPHFTFLLHR